MAGIVGIVASLSAPALEVGKCFKKQFNYLFYFRTNIKDLTDAAKDLEDVRADLHDQVDEAERNGERISHQVQTWITRADETRAITHGIPTQIPGCLNLKSRYSLSRKAKKTAESINELRDGCKFDRVSNPALPAALVQAPPLRPTRGIVSRMKTEEDIIMAMRDTEVYVIGVCGMGGVGKTTMAKQIMNRAREEEGLFDEVLLVPVGQQVDMLKIQHGIADWLSLKLEEETLEPRAIRLRARLEGGKRKLIVIDDVWERICLEDLGIPCKSGSCTILLTSRNKSVVDQMKAQRVFTIQILPNEEAWSMFQENVGACVDDPNLLPIAEEVAKECKGLPLALVTVSRALKDQCKPIWEDALKQLKISNPMDIPGVIKEVYNPIKLSYDFLDSPHAKPLLLLCSSFPEDWEINLEYLASYGFGLAIFTDINNLEEARNRITGLVVMLKIRFLILDGRDEHHVKMHDVVRDVAIFIASKEKPILELTSMDWSRQNPRTDYNMISVVLKKGESDFPMGRTSYEEEIELPIDLTFQSLHFLWMHCGLYPNLKISDHFFKGMQQLKVLHMESFSLGSTLQTMQLSKHLHTLHLEGCILERLSIVGELLSLEIFICRWCYSFEELPVEIGSLNRLRLLEVSYCESLKTIMAGVISRLVELEELKMKDSFKGWESVEKGKEGRNASLAELVPLRNLRCLCIEIEDCSLAAQNLQLPSKIVKYDIRIGNSPKKEISEFSRYTHHEKTLRLNLPMGTLLIFGDWIDELARSAGLLEMNGDITFDFASCYYTQNKRYFHLTYCWTVEKFGVFPMLEKLDLGGLPNLVEVCDGQIPSNDSFAKLNKIVIRDCAKLRTLFSTVTTSLETLRIFDCESMDVVFSIDHVRSPITFPKLSSLILRNLESLTTLCKVNPHDDISIEFPRLVELIITQCPKLTSFSNMNCASFSSDSIHLFCSVKVKFGSLKKLKIKEGYENMSYIWCHHIPHAFFFGGLEEFKISYCANINNLFSYSIAANLVNLKSLMICRCNEMVYVIADDNGTQTKPLIIFHKLENVFLSSLPKLQSFCEGSWDLQFPSLKRVLVWNFPGMEVFTLGSVSSVARNFTYWNYLRL